MYSFFKNVAREMKIMPNHVNHKEIASRLTGRNSSLKVIKMLSRLVEVLSERCLLGLAKKELVLCSNERTDATVEITAIWTTVQAIVQYLSHDRGNSIHR